MQILNLSWLFIVWFAYIFGTNFVITWINRSLKRLIPVDISGYYWRNVGKWTLSFAVVFTWKPYISVVLYYLGKLIVVLVFEMNLIAKKHAQAILNRTAHPLQHWAFPPLIHRKIANSAVKMFGESLNSVKYKIEVCKTVQLYADKFSIIPLLSQENMHSLVRSLVYYPDYPF